MDALSYLSTARQKYLDYYRAVLRQQRATTAECTPEVWVRPNADPAADEPPEPLCIDILTRTPISHRWCR